MAQLTPKQALDSKKTFYAKKSQQNGYYPIYKYEYNMEKGLWELFTEKESGWKSYGFAQEKPIVVNGETITNYSWHLYILEHDSYLLSDEPMKDNKNFNLQ